MRGLTAIGLLSLVCVHHNLFAQKDQFGIKGGANASNLSVSFNSDSRFKAGLNLGFYYKAHLGKKFYFRPELYYSSQGQREDFNNNSQSVTSLNYVNIPLLLEIGEKISFTAGPQVGLLLSAYKHGDIYALNSFDNIRSKMHDIDIALVLGINLKLNRTLHAGVRLNKGFSNIFLDESKLKIQNNVFHFYLGIQLKSESLQK